MVETGNRRVVQIEPKRRNAGHESTRILDFLNRHLIILLGDPGAGKTYCFKRMAAAEGAPVYSVQRFVSRNGDEQASIVYLDGLDEYRPRTSSRDSNPAIALLQILRKSGVRRVRLSCRFADWLGNTDLELFNDYCRDYVVLALQPLEEQEAIEILAGTRISEPETFLAEATARHMEWMVSNPQNLLMLANVVTDSGWPATKRDLFEQWSLRHLKEYKPILHDKQLGSYAAADLLDAAGAACAALLISDVIGIRRGPSVEDHVPSYRSVPYPNQEAVLAALSRSAFSSAEPDVATYVHRTIAEYLGARWLGKKVAEGLPLSRVQALIGVDSHPSPSLRGLHAWLPLFVPLQASALISKDPIGVLMYGDAASLHASHKTDLITSIAALAAENAWFLNEGFSNYGLAGLSSPDTAEELIRIIRSAASPLSLKTLALRAISTGEPMACYRAHLEQILVDPTALSVHRQLAFRSLVRYGPSGAAAIARVYFAGISRESRSIGLKAAIVGGLYGHPFGPADVIAVFDDAATPANSEVIGELWPLGDGIPVPNLLEILEAYECRSERRPPLDNSRNYDVAVCVEQMIRRLCEAIPESDPALIERFLKVLRGIYEKDLGTPNWTIRLDRVLSDRPRLVQLLVDSAVAHMSDFEHPTSIGFALNSMTAGAVTIKMVAERLCAELDGAHRGGDLFPPDMLQKYEALGKCLFNSGQEAATTFERFIEMGRSHQECKALLEKFTKCEIDERRLRPSPYAEAVAEFWAKLRSIVETQGLALERGENLDLQGKLAKLYCGFYSEEPKHQGRAQLIRALGTPLTESVERGFVAIVEEQLPPVLSDIAAIAAADQLYLHWYAFLAGMDLRWAQKHDLSGLSRDTLASAFAFSLLLDTFNDHGNHFPGNAREWSRRILCDRPDIAEAVCTTLLAERLRQKHKISTLLPRLPGIESAPWRGKLSVRLLLDYEPTDMSDLQELCIIALESEQGRQQLSITAHERVFEGCSNCPTQNLVWIVVGFLLTGDRFEPKLAEAAGTHPETLWIIRSLTQSSSAPTDRPSARFELSLRHMEFIVRTFGPISLTQNSVWPSGEIRVISMQLCI